jgi:hypothetical protein
MTIYYDKILRQYVAFNKDCPIVGIGETREEAINKILKYVWR